MQSVAFLGNIAFNVATPFQVVLAIILFAWACATLLFYFSKAAFEKERRFIPGYAMFRKYTPNWWQKTTLVVLAIWLLLAIISLLVS